MLQDRSSTKVRRIEGFTRGLQNAPFRVAKDKSNNWWWWWCLWCCTSSAFSSLPAFAKRSAKAWVTFKNSSPCSALFIKSNQNFATKTRYKEGFEKKTPKLLLVQASSHQVVGKRSAKAPLQCVPVKQKKETLPSLPCVHVKHQLISTEGALWRPMTYDNHPIRPPDM